MMAAVRQAAGAAPAYLVGGAVRDALLGRTLHDLDFAVGGDAAAAAYALGARLGAPVVTLDEDRRVFRLALPRGRRTIDISPLEGTLEHDLRRRDFTVDAMAVDVSHTPPQILDPLGGQADVQARLVRATGEGVFGNDPVRLLRAVRIAAELGFAIEQGTAQAIRTQAHRLGTVSPERVRDEFFRTLAVPGAGENLRLLDRLGLLMMIVPEMEAARGCGQPKEHQWDVLEHTMEVVAAVERVLRQKGPPPEGTPWDEAWAAYFDEETSGGRTRATLLKLAALLHDVSKPETKTVEANGRIRFFGHPDTGAQRTEAILKRLRCSNLETRLAAAMVREHLRPGLLAREPEGPTRRAVHRFLRDAGDAAADTLFLSFADYMGARGPLMVAEDWGLYAAGIRAMLDQWRGRQEQILTPKLANGDDLMQALGMPPGPALAPLLEAIDEAQAAGEISIKDEAVALARKLAARGAQPPKGHKA
ncbi:MAG: CCA tRNA nucleotidyltransferase [Dehalococcoidia bacterium]|nr:CCA tRNA nucleotidyltransferase [Dehalococcoidia bacterium]